MAQKDIATLRTQAQQIRDESVDNANTVARVGGMHEDQNDSALNVVETSSQQVVGNIEFLANVLADKLAADVADQINTGDFGGGVAIGSGYGGISTAPLDGLIVEGRLGIGTDIPVLTTGVAGLHIKGEGAENRLETTTSASIFYSFIQNNIRKGLIQYRSSDKAVKISQSETAPSAGENQLTVSEGKVGVGLIATYLLEVNGEIAQHALSTDPDDPPNNTSVKWQSDGTGSGDDGDIMMKITDSGGDTKIITLIDFSAI